MAELHVQKARDVVISRKKTSFFFNENKKERVIKLRLQRLLYR